MVEVTVVIKARNEEVNVRSAIESAQLLAGEVIIVDDRSTDRTVSVAKELGALIIAGDSHDGLIDRLDIQGFKAASGKWILRMDADERLTPELAKALRSIAASDASGARYSRQYHMFGKAIRYGGWAEPHQLGFFKADSWDKNWTAQLHSQVPVHGPIVTLPIDSGQMIHYDYESVEEFVNRSLRGYACREGRELAASGYVATLTDLSWRPMRKFLGRYFLRKGYRDGYRGLLLAGLLGVYEFILYAVAWDQSRKP